MSRDPIVEVNILPIPEHHDEWLVEAIDSDGGVHRAIFSGAYSEHDARIWAGAAYPEVGFNYVGPPQRLPASVRPELTVVGGTDTAPTHGRRE